MLEQAAPDCQPSRRALAPETEESLWTAKQALTQRYLGLLDDLKKVNDAIAAVERLPSLASVGFVRWLALHDQRRALVGAIRDTEAEEAAVAERWIWGRLAPGRDGNATWSDDGHSFAREERDRRD